MNTPVITNEYCAPFAKLTKRLVEAAAELKAIRKQRAMLIARLKTCAYVPGVRCKMGKHHDPALADTSILIHWEVPAYGYNANVPGLSAKDMLEITRVCELFQKMGFTVKLWHNDGSGCAQATLTVAEKQK